MNQTDIILSQIMLASIEGRATTRKLTETRFDCRNDVVVSPQTSAIAVAITLFNEKRLSPGNEHRIRRKLTLTLTDAESDARLSSKTVTVNIPGCLMSTEMRAHLPFKAISLPLDHDYNLIVTDAATGVQLGHREFHVFSNRFLERDTHEDEFTEEDFDRLLDEFIKSEKEATSADNDTEETGRNSDKDSHEDSDSLSNELQQLVGLTEVKQKLITYGKMMKFNAMRSEAGLPVVSAPLHAMFLGSPGTGKTTVAKMIGKMLHDVGLLSKGHVVVRERATLSGTHYGDHEDLTLKALEEAKGGILFIDEAYQLFQQNDSKDPGKLVLETLLTALADEDNRDWMLILAGYRDEMIRLFDMNPGLRSRIPEANIYTFEDFSESELMEIADRWFKKNKYNLTADAREALVTRLSSDYAARDRSFGNARHVVNLIQTSILPSMASRIMDQEMPSRESLTDILPSDIPAASALMQPTRRRIGFNP